LNATRALKNATAFAVRQVRSCHQFSPNFRFINVLLGDLHRTDLNPQLPSACCRPHDTRGGTYALRNRNTWRSWVINSNGVPFGCGHTWGKRTLSGLTCLCYWVWGRPSKDSSPAKRECEVR